LDWFHSYFREPYGEIYADYLLPPEISREEADFASWALDLKRSDWILDCPCGYGRHVEILAERLPRVVGLDLDPDCLGRGRQWAPDMKLVRGDMRAMPFPDARFDAVLNLFNSFGYFSEADNARTIAEFARVVKPGGLVLMDMANAAPLVEIVTEEPVTSQQVMDLLLTESWHYDPLSGRLYNETHIEKGGKIIERRYDLRIYDLVELDELLDAAGLERVDVYGEFDGSDYDADESARMIVVAEKA